MGHGRRTAVAQCDTVPGKTETSAFGEKPILETGTKKEKAVKSNSPCSKWSFTSSQLAFSWSSAGFRSGKCALVALSLSAGVLAVGEVLLFIHGMIDQVGKSQSVIARPPVQVFGTWLLLPLTLEQRREGCPRAELVQAWGFPALV